MSDTYFEVCDQNSQYIISVLCLSSAPINISKHVRNTYCGYNMLTYFSRVFLGVKSGNCFSS